MFKNTKVTEAMKSKEMWGGFLMIGVGFFMVINGKLEIGAGALALGLNMVGKRDNQNGQG